jgi:hypothetical protein
MSRDLGTCALDRSPRAAERVCWRGEAPLRQRRRRGALGRACRSGFRTRTRAARCSAARRQPGPAPRRAPSYSRLATRRSAAASRRARSASSRICRARGPRAPAGFRATASCSRSRRLHFGLISSRPSRRNEALLDLLDGLAVSYGGLVALRRPASRAPGGQAVARPAPRGPRAAAPNPQRPRRPRPSARLRPTSGEGRPPPTFLAGRRDGAAPCHLSWHLALALALGRPEDAWTLYRAHPPGQFYGAALITLSGSVSFLWRCRLWDGRGAVAWGELRDFARRSFRFEPGLRRRAS